MAQRYSLQELTKDLTLNAVTGDLTDTTISHLAFDSRAVVPGSLFVAVRGTRVDGHDYIAAARNNGAVAIVAETPPPAATDGVVWLQVPDSAAALGWLATAYYGYPSRDFSLVGITGTNGKTTVATLLFDLFTGLGYRCGLVSTVEVRVGEQLLPSTHTTPDPLALNAALAAMRDAGCDYVFMEVSSHAVVQQRIAGLTFAGGVFTNMSHDHLDYHGSFRAYIEAKKMFFDNLSNTAFALVNADDKRGAVMVQNTKAAPKRYSLRGPADFKAKILANSPEGLQLEIDGKEVHFRLLGAFNAYNLLAAYGTAVLLGQAADEVLTVLSALTGARGRLEYVRAPAGHLTGVVDYAHTPDALEKVLETLREIQQRAGGRILTVVGAGGDRDRAKRPKMAAIAARLSDQVVLTSDNPRGEAPATILDAMEAGLTTPAARAKTLRIEDRRSAIRTAVRLARPGDLILVAGKGHENYQEIKGTKYPFDDRQELLTAFAEQNPT
jgi:UDP-N-acetylmuramoyl-L-alanyl-D-glutamate--2,6-diaminopimelate ligase